MLGLGASLIRGGSALLSYIRDGLKLYMPYNKDAVNKGVQFVGTGSASFDGSDYISVADSDDFTFADGTALTISIWFKTSEATDEMYLFDMRSGWGSSAGISALLDGNSTNYLGYFTDGSNGAGFTNTTDYHDGAWHHLAATFDGTSVATTYIDGVSIGTNTQALGAINCDDLVIGMGQDKSTSGFQGNLKNFAIWNRALTATEVQNVMYKSYAEVTGRLASGLVSWWALEHSYAGESNLYVKDEAGSNNGTLGDGGLSGATHPTMANSSASRSLYGGDTPVIPRAIDNAPTVQADAIGSGSASFGGSGDLISIGDNSSLDLEDAFTITMWFNPTAIDHNESGLIAKMTDDGDGYGMYLDAADDKLKGFNKAYNHTVDSTTTFTDLGTWHHAALTYLEGSALKLYVDGVLESTSTSTTQIAAVVPNTRNLEIGNMFDSPNDTNGKICQVGLWDAVLTQAQIQSIMEKTYEELTASEKTNLASYWALDEKSGVNGVLDKVDETLGTDVAVNGDLSSDPFVHATNYSGGWKNFSQSAGTATWSSANQTISLVGDGGGGRGIAVARVTTVSGKAYKISFTQTSTPVNCIIRINTDGSWTSVATGSVSNASLLLGSTHYFIATTTGYTYLVFEEGNANTWTFGNLKVEPTNGNTGVLI